MHTVSGYHGLYLLAISAAGKFILTRPISAVKSM